MKTLPQQSYGFAAGRVQVLSKSLLNRTAVERLLALSTVEEVARALTEMNWGDVRDKSGIERVAEAHVQEAAELMRDISPDTAATDCFLVKYDALNLKMLIKARVLGQLSDALPLSPCGLMDPARLRRAVEENRYIDLPSEFKDAMERIEKTISVKMDPLFVDAELDKAMQRFINRRLQDTNDAVVKQFFLCRAETTNLLIALRSHSVGRDGAFARGLFLPGGTLDSDRLAKVADEPERALDAIAGRPYASALGVPLRKTPFSLSEVERAADDYLTSLLRVHKSEIMSVLPLVGYLLAREREAGAVRLIATGKSAHVALDQLEARLRAMY